MIPYQKAKGLVRERGALAFLLTPSFGEGTCAPGGADKSAF